MTRQNNGKEYTAEEMREMKRDAWERMNKPAVKKMLLKSFYPAMKELADESAALSKQGKVSDRDIGTKRTLH